MPVQTRELLNLLAEICDEKDLKVCVTESLKGALLAGCTTGIGGLLLGPAGLAIGGIVGGVLAQALSLGRFRPASQVLLDLPDSKKQILYTRLQRAFKDFGAADMILLANMIMAQNSIKNMAFEELRRFFTNDLHFPIQ